MKKKSGKSKAARPVRDLPEKAPNARTTKNLKGGVTFSYGSVGVSYQQQKPEGTKP